ncbi:rhodanese-like domain-containing protein [Flavobacteriaceae bacterium]|nr:rhodanese-like domain-containing protein [Flavobacteriaceae bacterium]
MKNITQVQWEELVAQDENAVIIDARTPRECAEGIIENAVMIDKSKNFYVYCRSGNRSGQACQILNRMGAENVFNLSGGMLDWRGKTVVPA